MQIQEKNWPSPLDGKHVHWPPDGSVHCSFRLGHDQKPNVTSTCGHCPFGPAGCGIARPSAVCAAAATAVGSDDDEPLLGAVLVELVVVPVGFGCWVET